MREAGRAEVVCVGTELLSGRVDTHTAFLARRLASAGLGVARSAAVRDQLAEVRDAVVSAAGRARVVVVCGGLGPTFDDLTRDAVAAAFGLRLAFRPELYALILRRYRRFRLRVPVNNRRQAYLIEGARPLDNPHGSAPGQRLELPDGRLVYLLPGPPSELYPMFDAHVLPELARRFGGGLAARRRVFRFYGVPEAAADQRLTPLMAANPDVEFTILADLGLVELHATARAERAAGAERVLGRIERRVAAAMGEAYYSREGESLAEALGTRLLRRKWTLATAESCTGGLVGGALTSVPGSSRFYLGGVVTYSNAAKASTLGVPAALLKEHGAVSGECVRAMLRGVQSRFSADAGIAVTGIAGPDGGTKAKPVGLVYIAAGVPGRSRVLRRVFPGSREQVRRRAVMGALDLLRSLVR